MAEEEAAAAPAGGEEEAAAEEQAPDASFPEFAGQPVAEGAKQRRAQRGEQLHAD